MQCSERPPLFHDTDCSSSFNFTSLDPCANDHMVQKRRGITDTQIREAIDLLQGEGESPSPAKIRRILGSGSYSTICRVLSTWREEQSASAENAPDMPASVKRLASQLWKEANNVAQKAHNAARIGFETERREWQAEKNDLVAEIESLEGHQSELAANLKAKESLLDEALKRNSVLEKEISATAARAETLEEQLSRYHEQWPTAKQQPVASNGSC